MLVISKFIAEGHIWSTCLQLSLSGDTHMDTPRNDASPALRQWHLKLTITIYLLIYCPLPLPSTLSHSDDPGCCLYHDTSRSTNLISPAGSRASSVGISAALLFYFSSLAKASKFLTVSSPKACIFLLCFLFSLWYLAMSNLVTSFAYITYLLSARFICM